MSEDWFRVNVNEEGIDIVHHDPPTPKCDIRNMDEDVSVDLRTVAKMIEEGTARYCRHCFPER